MHLCVRKCDFMFNMNSKKTKRNFSIALIILLVVLMVIPSIFAFM